MSLLPTAAKGTTPLTSLNYINFGAYLLNVAVTYLSFTGIFGDSNSVLSAKYQALVTPAGWAFSIWGPIFIWEAVAVFAQLHPVYRDSPVIQNAQYWWAAACLSQVLWTPVFSQELMVLSLVCMLSILFSLTGLAYQMYYTPCSVGQFWLLKAPFQLHLGWIVAASVVNSNVVVIFYDAQPTTQVAAAIVSVAAVLGAGIYASSLTAPNCFVTGVGAWALGAVAFELNGGGKEEFSKIQDNFPVIVIGGLGSAAAVVSVVLAVLTVVGVVRHGIGIFIKRVGTAGDDRYFST